VEETISPTAVFTRCDVLDLQGRVVMTDVAWAELSEWNRLPFGIYLARETRTGMVRKVVMD
jgi:hypothetical protein